MSQKNVSDFYRELENIPSLRAEALQLQMKYQRQEEIIEAFIKLGKSRGYVFTAAELVQYIFTHGKEEK